jgi:hypothetical protein
MLLGAASGYRSRTVSLCASGNLRTGWLRPVDFSLDGSLTGMVLADGPRGVQDGNFIFAGGVSFFAPTSPGDSARIFAGGLSRPATFQGISLASNWISFYRNGNVAYALLNGNQQVQGYSLMGGFNNFPSNTYGSYHLNGAVLLNENGSFKQGSLSQPMTLPSGIILPAYTEVCFDDQKRLIEAAVLLDVENDRFSATPLMRYTFSNDGAVLHLDDWRGGTSATERSVDHCLSAAPLL